MSDALCFPPKCAHKGPARYRITQDSCAHRPFKGECAQQKRIPRCLWQVLRAHFGKRHRREIQPMKACFLPRHRPSTYPVCVAAQNPHFWPGTPSRHRRNKGMVSVVAEKEFRIPNPKCTFPINAGRTGRRLSGSSGSFCCLSVLNNNGGLFRQIGARESVIASAWRPIAVRLQPKLNCPLKVGRVIDLF